MELDTGTVLAVNVVPLGDVLAADTPAGATTLTVMDSVDFPETGGSLTVNGEIIAYTGVDDDTDLITLATPLVTAAVEGDPVRVWDVDAQAEASEVIAQVQMDGDDHNDDAMEATVSHALIPFLVEGIRDEDGEYVRLEWQGGDLVVVEVYARTPLISGTTARSDDFVPGVSGWAIYADGSAEFNNVDARGNIEAVELLASDGAGNSVEISQSAWISGRPGIKFTHSDPDITDGAVLEVFDSALLGPTLSVHGPQSGSGSGAKRMGLYVAHDRVRITNTGSAAGGTLEVGDASTPVTVKFNGQPVPRIASGLVTVSMTTTATPPWGGTVNRGTLTINFPAGRFTVAPRVATSVVTGLPFHRNIGIQNVTATSFEVVVDSTGTAAIGVQWVAVEEV